LYKDEKLQYKLKDKDTKIKQRKELIKQMDERKKGSIRKTNIFKI